MECVLAAGSWYSTAAQAHEKRETEVSPNGDIIWRSRSLLLRVPTVAQLS